MFSLLYILFKKNGGHFDVHQEKSASKPNNLKLKKCRRDTFLLLSALFKKRK